MMVQKDKAKSPRPDFYRASYMSLNGSWEFAFDDENLGVEQEWYLGLPEQGRRRIQVPYCYQSKAGGIGDTGKHSTVWYEKKFKVPEKKAVRTFLHFGAVDYEAVIWVNGIPAGQHRGGHTPFSFEISKYYRREEEVTVTVLCRDSYSCAQPRGKQHWNIQTDRCWYTATTGIWQDVWLEFSGGTRMERAAVTPDIDKRQVNAEVFFSEEVRSGVLNWELKAEGKVIGRGSSEVSGHRTELIIAMDYPDPIDNQIRLWSPAAPFLYDLNLILECVGEETDAVETYFGMRRIECIGDKIYLNHSQLYQKLVLDQGYWPDGLLTPPSHESFAEDIALVKEMGFNGVRKHQKIEAPAFLYYADCMGLLVWEEMPSNYEFSQEGMKLLQAEYQEVLQRDYNHPCIITWVPFNESWGIRDILWDKRQQAFAQSLYYLTKAYDPTRPVSTNDGWEAVTADITGIHDYESSGEALFEEYENREKLLSGAPAGKELYADGFAFRGEPVLLSEFGGVAMEDGKKESWGYDTKAAGEDEFLRRIAGLFEAIGRLPYLAGYCYTQLTDVEQETNGLLKADRTPKVPVERIRGLVE